MARLGRGQPFKPIIRKPIINAASGASPTWVTDTPPLVGTAGSFYSYTYHATGSPAPTYSVSTGSIPAGLALNPFTGVLSGTPTTVTSYTFKITATNTAGSVTTSSTTIVIGGAENPLTVAWATIVATGYLYDVNLRPVPATNLAITRPQLLALWVQVLGSLVTDPYPSGTLALVVTPSTGVTITDNNFDGTGHANNIGNGTAAENASSQAEAGFQVSFASTGTFTVSATYTSTDGNYASAAITNPLTIVVT